VKAPNSIPFDPRLLQQYSIVRTSPSWEDVKESMTRLLPLLEQSANPYDQMDLDRDNVLRFATNLESSAESIAYAICLAAHLARFSKTKVFEQRLNDGFVALSTGLDLGSLSETETRSELQRCARAAFPDFQFGLPPLTVQKPVSSVPVQEAAEPAPESPGTRQASEKKGEEAQPAPTAPALSQPAEDPWRIALESALSRISIMLPPSMNDVIRKAADSWQARLTAFLTGSSGQAEIPPDIDYLRCRAANLPLGMVLRGRLRNVSLRDWNEAYVSGMSVTGDFASLPLWFALAALGALGFDVPRKLDSASYDEMEAAESFVSKIQTGSPPKGLLILRLTAESQTAEWKISASMPALILTSEDFLREGKANLRSYFQPRLHGVLIEMSPDELPAAAQTRANINTIKDQLPSVRVGFLMRAQNEIAKKMANGVVALSPADAGEAYTQAFSSPSASAA
jgi:hypothetical protein